MDSIFGLTFDVTHIMTSVAWMPNDHTIPPFIIAQ